MGHLAQQIKAIDLWGEPPVLESPELVPEKLANLTAELDAAKQKVINQMDRNLNDIVNYYDQIWQLHDRVADQASFAFVTGVADCEELRKYSQICQKLALGKQGRQILLELDGVERSLKARDFQSAFVGITALLGGIPDLRLPGFKAYVTDYTHTLIESCRALIVKVLLNGESVNFGLAVDLLTIDRALCNSSECHEDQSLLCSVAHAIWFKVDKWKLPTPPDLKWLELEACNTGAAIYYCWSANRDTASDKSADGSSSRHQPGAAQIEAELVGAGLQELFFRYLSYRSEDDIIFRARDFSRNILGIAWDEKIRSAWRGLVRSAARAGWKLAITSSELMDRAVEDREKVRQQLLAKESETDTCPVNGVEVQIKIVAAMSLAAELVDRVSVTLDDEDRGMYLDATLEQGLVRLTLDDLKTQWNEMDDPWDSASLTASIIIFNSLCYMYRSLTAISPKIDQKYINPIKSTRERIMKLLAEEAALCNGEQTAIDKGNWESPVLVRFSAEVAAEDFEEVKKMGQAE